MPKRAHIPVVAVLIFVALLVSYKFSLLHETSQLGYLASESVPLFYTILTYTFMLVGIIPTTLLILYTSFLCATTVASGIITTTCFGAPFAVSETSGFFAWIVAVLITMLMLWIVFSTLLSHAAPGKQK